MEATRTALKSKDQTGKAMYKMVRRFAKDLQNVPVRNKFGKIVPINKLSLREYFDIVRSIPYGVDPKPREILARPKYALRARHLDCKKKALLMGSWAKMNNVPFRFIASSNRPNGRIHHTYTEMKIGGRWVPMDATYNTYLPGLPKQLTNYEILKG